MVAGSRRSKDDREKHIGPGWSEIFNKKTTCLESEEFLKVVWTVGREQGLEKAARLLDRGPPG